MNPPPNRIEYLDGIRGVAILCVLLFHAYPRWPEFMPFGDAYAESFLKFGYLGVQLFFLVSGFVIFMTLDRSSNIVEFAIRRFSRLFPSMLVCSLIIYFSSGFFHERPAGQPSFLDLIPGLVFVEPNIVSLLIGEKVRSLEGAFWSLYVEVKFYVFCAIIYFGFGRKFLIPALLAAWLISVIPTVRLGLSGTEFDAAKKFLQSLFSISHYSWFIGGALCYEATRSPTKNLRLVTTVAAILLNIVTLYIQARYKGWGHFFAGLVILGIFHACFYLGPLRSALRNKVFIFLGFISYPLYLVHENMLVSISVKAALFLPSIPSWLSPVPGIIFVTSIAYFVAKHIEPHLQSFLKNNLLRLLDGFKQ